MQNEADLIRRSQGGDGDAFNALVLAYQDQVYRFTIRMLGHAQAAEDATQETFLNAYRAIRSFRGDIFRPWLLRIASNACHDHLRSRQRRPSESLDAILEDPARQSILTSPAPSPEDRALQQELSEAITRGLTTLPEDLRLAVALVDVQGLSYEEAAEVMRVPLGTVKSRLSRGRAQLRDYLLGLGELLPQVFRP